MSTNSDIDDAGNDLRVWVATAGDLLASRNTLAKGRSEAEEIGKKQSMPRPVLPEERSYWIEVMLVGFAVENLLKALWIVRGNALYRNGKLVKIGVKKSHDLVSIANRVGFPVTDPERNELSMLSEIMIGVGRYPMAPRPEEKGFTESWGSTSDSIMQKLVQRLKITIRNEEPS